jgi:IS5 family transposase
VDKSNLHPKAGNGRRPYPLETMLRIHCMQLGTISVMMPSTKSLLCVRLSLDNTIPDRTTIMNFRHLLEQHQLARKLFKTIDQWLSEAGVMMTQGTLVDATLIEAPSSTKNKQQQREELAKVKVDWLIAERPEKVKTLKEHLRKNKVAINIEYMKASIRAKVEHPFRIIKRQFGFVKAKYNALLGSKPGIRLLSRGQHEHRHAVNTSM